jgi:hypothetical protein
MVRALSTLSALALVVAMPVVVHAEPEELDPTGARTRPATVTPLPPAPGPLLTPGPFRRSPAAVREFGWNAGLGLGAVLGGPQLLVLAAYPLRITVDLWGRGTEGNIGTGIAGFFLGALGVVAVGLGIAESAVGGIYYRNNARLRPEAGDAELSGAWRAGVKKGSGVVLLIHGALSLVTCGAVLWAVQTHDVGTMTRSLRDLSIVGVALGGVDVIVGGALAVAGYRWTFNPGRVALLPVGLPGGAGAVLGGTF